MYKGLTRESIIVSREGGLLPQEASLGGPCGGAEGGGEEGMKP